MRSSASINRADYRYVISTSCPDIELEPVIRSNQESELLSSTVSAPEFAIEIALLSQDTLLKKILRNLLMKVSAVL